MAKFVVEKSFKQKKNCESEERPIHNWEKFIKLAKFKFNNKMSNKTIKHANLDDIQFFNLLGEGGFGKVYLAQYNPAKSLCAIKIINKRKMLKLKQSRQVHNEIQILSAIKFNFLINLLFYMEDEINIYIGLPFIKCGDLGRLLDKFCRFAERDARFYAAQILLALEYLHYMHIIHRDLKPENILLEENGYIKITDMGSSKLLILYNTTSSFCGTAEYMAPEIITNRGYGVSVDWWSFGVLVYELVSGYTPFYAATQSRIFNNILRGTVTFLPYITFSTRHLIINTLKIDPRKRLGCSGKGVQDLKDHKWFKDVNWLAILNRKVRPPILPLA